MMKEMLYSGVELMLVGMGIVFLMLALLVAMVNFMAWLIRRFFPESVIEKPAPTPRASVEGDVVAAITAAIHEFRNRR